MSLARRRSLLSNVIEEEPSEKWYSYAPVSTIKGIKWVSGTNGATQQSDNTCASIYTAAYIYPKYTFNQNNGWFKFVNFIPLKCANRCAVKVPNGVYSQVILLNSTASPLNITIGEWVEGLNVFEKGDSVGFLVNYKHENGSPFTEDWYTADFDILCDLQRLDVQYSPRIGERQNTYELHMNYNGENCMIGGGDEIFYRIVNGSVELLLRKNMAWTNGSTTVAGWTQKNLMLVGMPINGATDYYKMPITQSELETIDADFPIFNIEDLT